ncbi:MAG TPA: LysM peptidoglycan-binding domain-containing protein [Verrucomicrobiae bacterium]|nr:LysM peptidoglycan-binding domain-containing protein [Verrucomicrobiae bacterium]
MNSTNPFQLPAWSAINREQRRQARFKKTVISIIAAIVLLLIGLLIEGCRSERAALVPTETPPSQAQVGPAMPQTPMASAEEQKPGVSPPSEPATASPALPPVAKENIVPTASQSGTIYVVKSGDTLTRIARTYGTTIKAIEAANELNGDRIVVGAKLKIPEA